MNRRWVVWSVLALSLVGLWWAILHFSGQLLEARLRSTINDRPDRAYDFKFGKLVVQAGFSGVELLDITITPRFADSLDLSVLGELDRASIQGLKWYALMVEGQLILESIEFKRPHFRVYRRAKPTDMRSDIAVSDRSEPAQKRGLQSVFTDLLKRGELSDFLVSEAYAAYYLIDRDTVEFARVFGLHLHATGIETDRMHWDSPVPFELNRFRLKIDSIRAQPSGNTELQTGAIDYDSEHNKLSLRSVKWQHTRNWVEISREMGEQKDLFELELDALDITGIRALNRIFEDLEVDAHKLSLTGMRFFDYKNKNLPLKKKEYKPMFHGMLRRIPVPLQLDTVEIRNSRIEYREIAEHYAKPGLIVFDNFEAEVYHLSNLKTYQREHRQLVAYLRTRFNGSGALKARLEVPYRGERFHLEAEMGPMPLSALNTTLEPLAGVRGADYGRQSAPAQIGHESRQHGFDQQVLAGL